MSKNESNKGFNYLLLTSVIFGSFGVLANVLGRGFSTYWIVFILNTIQLVIFLVIVVIRKEYTIPKWDILIRFTLFGVINSFPLLFFNLAVLRESIGTVLLIQNLATIVFSVGYSFFWLKERINYLQLGLIVLALLGIATIYLPSKNPDLLGIVYALLVGIFNGTSNVFRRTLGQKYSPYVISLFTSLIGVIIFGFLSKDVLKISAMQLTVNSSFLIICYGALNALTTFLLLKGLSSIKFTIGNIVLLLEVVFGSILGLIFLRQGWEYNMFIGNMVVFISLLMIRVIDFEIEDAKIPKISSLDLGKHKS
jgi:drug/metabolite transporter (DMT)-like permease